MLRQWSIRLGLVVVVASLSVGQASAQIFGGFPNYGLYSFGGSAPYITSPYSSGFSGGGYYPMFYSGYYASTFTVPGWAANSTGAVSGAGYMAESRANLFPAVALPASSPLLQVETVSGTKAEVVVAVPNSQAMVWVEGVLTSQTGLLRRYATPRLQLGKDYLYEIVVQWTDHQGQVRTARRSITIHAGDEAQLAFRQ